MEAAGQHMNIGYLDPWGLTMTPRYHYTTFYHTITVPYYYITILLCYCNAVLYCYISTLPWAFVGPGQVGVARAFPTPPRNTWRPEQGNSAGTAQTLYPKTQTGPFGQEIWQGRLLVDIIPFLGEAISVDGQQSNVLSLGLMICRLAGAYISGDIL